MILVTGGTGNVGGHVVRQLVEAGEKVRVLTRDPGAHSFPDGVEVVPGDLRRPETLRAALSGAPRVFLFPVMTGLGGFLDAARRADTRHLVLLSSVAATYRRLGWIGEKHLRLENEVSASGIPWTFVRPGAFMTNDLAWKREIQEAGVVRAAYGNAATAPVDSRDIAAVAVRALLDERAGESFSLTGPESLTQVERVRIIAETVGWPVRFEELSPDEHRERILRLHAGLPEPGVDELLDLLAENVGKDAEVLPTVEEVTGRPAFTYAEWAATAGFAPVQP
ncbi:NAD(P)H-binding protein [Actinomadura chibensis]|uniref:NAD(P)H-binding protein n=1 Tax=Actinomadura chibensis TaxID=392828 RepID=A0A5D0NIR3_9ACTN|nr:NAD(P)H-binding protein [Actinomadura chibensis]TYB44175.1 NAD(P)H-binding protein [Actinomadura chibensis]